MVNMVTITYDMVEDKKSTLYEGIFKDIKSITEEARNKLNDVKSVISQVFNFLGEEEAFSSSTDAYQIRNSELSSFEEELTLEIGRAHV